MRALLLALALGAAVLQTAEPPEFPKGQYCAHPMRGQQPAHPCNCQRECVTNDDRSIRVVEDPQCKQWCHADHCHCPMKNCP